jgi:hypothetical protein
MTRYTLVALSNPAEGADDAAVSRWYDGAHIPEVRAAVPGVGEVHRLRTAITGPDGTPGTPYRYLTTYEVEANRPEDVLEALGAGMAAGTVNSGTVLDPATTVVAVFETASRSGR